MDDEVTKPHDSDEKKKYHSQPHEHDLGLLLGFWRGNANGIVQSAHQINEESHRCHRF